MEWVRAYNLNNAYPSVSGRLDTGNNLASIGVLYTLPGDWEYTEDQFRAYLTSGIDGAVGAAHAFLRDFAPAVLEQITAAQQQA